MKPERRREGLVVTALDGEVLVYDLHRHRAHCLNETAARVFERCDGRTSVGELARSFGTAGRAPERESVVWLALEKLDQAHLLADPLESRPGVPPLSRRELIRRGAIASAILLPIVTSVVAPTPAEAAASCVANCAGKAFGTPCSSTAPANCLCTCDGAGNCVGGC